MTIVRILAIAVASLAGLWFVFYLLCWLILIALCLPISMKKEYNVPSRFYAKVMNFGYWVLLGNCRVKYHGSGLEKVPSGTRFMLVSNHRSSFDNMVQTYLLKKEMLSYISKKENFKIPIGRHFMKKLSYQALDRGDIRSAVKVISNSINLIKNDYCSVGVFPEGTRTHDGLLGEFKPGCFKIALKAHCPIVVGITTGAEMVHRNWPWKRTHVYFDVIKVFAYEEIAEKTTLEISDMVRECILNGLHNKGSGQGPEYNEEFFHL